MRMEWERKVGYNKKYFLFAYCKWINYYINNQVNFVPVGWITICKVWLQALEKEGTLTLKGPSSAAQLMLKFQKKVKPKMQCGKHVDLNC